MLPPGPKPPPSNRRLVLYLVLLAAVLPEAITGSTPPAGWLNPFLAAPLPPLHGSRGLACRELAIRSSTGWPGLLLLGAACGLIHELLTPIPTLAPSPPMPGARG